MKIRLLVVCSAAVFSVAMVGSPVSADTPSLSDLQSTDAQLQTAIDNLNQQVAAQQTSLATAQQAADAADQATATDNVALAGLQAKIAVLQTAATQRAVEQYIRPQDDLLSHILSSDGLDDASRQTELLAEVNNQDYGTIDDLHAARVDLQHLQKAALAAQQVADQRKADEQKKLDTLNASVVDQTNTQKSIQARIDEFSAEAQASGQVSASGSDSEHASRGSDDNNDNSRVSSAGLIWPTDSRQINSPFGSRWGTLHPGIDIQASTGTPIHAAKAGKVTYASWESGYGNFVCIDHGGGFSTCYAHQSRIIVTVGQQVNQGDLVGYSGATGNVTGPHLHFETRVNNKPVDPMQYLPH